MLYYTLIHKYAIWMSFYFLSSLTTTFYARSDLQDISSKAYSISSKLVLPLCFFNYFFYGSTPESVTAPQILIQIIQFTPIQALLNLILV